MKQDIPVYTLGSADPRLIANKSAEKLTFWQKIKSFFGKKYIKYENPKSLQFLAFSGMDIKAWFHLKDGSLRSVSELQAFSIKSDDKKIYCDLTFIIFDKSSLYMVKDTKDIIFHAANEYGRVASCYLRDISFESYGSSISIDDLISEETIRISSQVFVPWIKYDIKEEPDMFVAKMDYLRIKQSDSETAERFYPEYFRDKYFKE